ncbi:pyridoxal-phosphate dependent enzyme [candidate division KSB1 bacterium]|nr:pyridoxal-phosphate dependent enzyme [candidate division KSB1 bacterium]
MNFEYRCVECGRNYDPGEKIMYVCPVCARLRKPKEPMHGILRVILPYSELSLELDRYSLQPHTLLPVEPEYLPSYAVGNTPLIAPHKIREQLGLPNLYLKDEGRNPNGSINDRASLLNTALAKKMNENKVIVASNGNEAAAVAGISSFCGLECVAFLPEDAPRTSVVQSMIYGAKVIRVKGCYDDAYELSIRYTDKQGGINCSTAYNPFTIEGKKTAALEIYNQLDCTAPDYVFIPTSDGDVLSGIYKGFYDLFQFDWIMKIPRLIAVQAEGSDSIVKGIKCNKIEPVPDASTIAESMCASLPLNGYMALKDIDRSEGFGVVVSDREILDAQHYLGQNAGIFSDLATAAAFAGLLKERSRLEKDAIVVILATGSGLTDIAAASKNVVLSNPIEPQVDVSVI